jgi:dihydropteroate synthase
MAAVEPLAGTGTLIMGTCNVTPDSFYDGGKFSSVKGAADQVRHLAEDGADIIDIGGESSRPGSDPVSIAEEQARVFPVLDALAGSDLRLSIDTYHAETARGALARGVTMINDITALRGDPEMASVVAEGDCDCVLMHMQGDPKNMQQAPRYTDVVDDVCAFFEERITFAVTNGICEDRIWIDPGFGFGKTVGHNLDLLRRLEEFGRFGRPVLIGTSNKSTIGAVLDLPVNERSEGTAATVAAAVLNGADAIRVHDVKSMKRVAAMADAIAGKKRYE